MGNHGVASAGLRAGEAGQDTAVSRFQNRRAMTLRDWPVSWRLIAVIVLALVMGLVFGGLRVAGAVSSASQFGRVSQLANLGQRVTGLVQALEDERDQTTGILPITDPKDLQRWYDATNAEAGQVRTLAAGIGGSYPTNIQARVATVLSVLKHLDSVRSAAQASQSALAVIAGYSAPITDMIALNDQIAQGTSDPGLVNDVQTLNSLSLAKDQAAQQRALLFNAFNQQIFADGVQQALITASSEELTELTAFDTTATPAEHATFNSTVTGGSVNEAQNIEIYVLGTSSLNIGAGALNIKAKAAPGQWYAAQSGKVDDMQRVELGVAQNIVTRAQSLQHSAEEDALINAIVTVLILLLVLLATVAVARSLVGPLRRLREGALTIATAELPERVRQLGEATDPSASLEVVPIDVLSADEIGQVARAFDQVHAEAVRLAGNEAMLRNSFNAMFVNLSRRSQSLIERLARMIDSLEQNEADPDRLSNLFSMDHLVTRMRRNSENLLLLAGHETTHKRSEPMPLADVARAATSEIEQYGRVTLKMEPGVAVTGLAVSDVVHLLAEILENATIYSAKDTQVNVSGQELTSGGVLIDVTDNGVGIPESRLAEMNWRLDDPPVIDVSVSRHMGLFAVARLAERHGVRVRLRARSPHGLTALVWLPDTLIERETLAPAWAGGRVSRPAADTASRATGAGSHSVAAHATGNGQTDGPTPTPGTFMPTPGAFMSVSAAPGLASREPSAGVGAGAAGAGAAGAGAAGAGAGAAGGAATTGAAVPSQPTPIQASGWDMSDWFRNPRMSSPGLTGNGGRPGASPSGATSSGGPGASSRADGWTGSDVWAEGKHAAQTVAEPVHGDQTAAGLPVRIPRANLIPGSVGHRADSRAADGHGAQAPAASRPPRSPDLARNRLSGFQRGTRRAKGQTPRAGEGADVELRLPPGP